MALLKNKPRPPPLLLRHVPLDALCTSPVMRAVIRRRAVSPDPHSRRRRGRGHARIHCRKGGAGRQGAPPLSRRPLAAGGGRRTLRRRGRRAPAGEVEGGVQPAALALPVLQEPVRLLLRPQVAGRLGPRDSIPAAKSEHGLDCGGAEGGAAYCGLTRCRGRFWLSRRSARRSGRFESLIFRLSFPIS